MTRTIAENLTRLSADSALKILRDNGEKDLPLADADDFDEAIRARITSMLHERIRDEVASDPSGAGYAGMMVEEIAQSMVSTIVKRETRPRPSRLDVLHANDVLWREKPRPSTLAELIADPELGAAIKSELQSDPTGRDYMATIADPAETFRKLTEPFDQVIKTVTYPARWPAIAIGIPCYPSTIGDGDIADALKI